MVVELQYTVGTNAQVSDQMALRWALFVNGAAAVGPAG